MGEEHQANLQRQDLFSHQFEDIKRTIAQEKQEREDLRDLHLKERDALLMTATEKSVKWAILISSQAKELLDLSVKYSEERRLIIGSHKRRLLQLEEQIRSSKSSS